MNFDYLYEYLVIYREGSLKGAAEELHTSASALSKHLSALEADLGCELLVRGRHVFEPTDVGVEIYEAAFPLFKVKTRIEDIARHGDPLLVYPMLNNDAFHALLCEAAHQFTNRHPGADVAIDAESAFNSPFSALVDGRVDVLAYDEQSITQANEGLVTKQVSEQRFQAVVTDRNPLAQRDQLEIDDLRGFALTRLSGSMPLLHHTWTAISRDCAQHGFRPLSRTRKIYLPSETSLLKIDDDEVLILYANSATIAAYAEQKGYCCIDIADMVHPVCMTCRKDNEQAASFIEQVERAANAIHA